MTLSAIPSYIIWREFALRVGTVISLPLVDICVTDFFARDAVELSHVLFSEAKSCAGESGRRALRLAAGWLSQRTGALNLAGDSSDPTVGR